LDRHNKWKKIKASRGRLLLIGLLAAALGLAGCGFRRGSSFPGVVRIPWPDQETTIMEVFHNDQPVGTSRLTVQKDGDEWLLTVANEAQAAREVSTIRAHGENLIPSFTQLRSEAEGDSLLLEGRYEARQVSVSVDGNETGSFIIQLPDPPYFDNEQVPFVLRAMPLAEGWQGGLNLVVIRNGTHAVVGAWVVDREAVETPLGTMDAWKVELRGLAQFAWIEVDPPHRLVKYVNEGANTITLITDYRTEAAGEAEQGNDDDSSGPAVPEGAGNGQGDGAAPREAAS